MLNSCTAEGDILLGAAFISKITDCNDRATPSFVEQKI
jgi:hypothetical protein